jgi:hypothetical protein
MVATAHRTRDKGRVDTGDPHGRHGLLHRSLADGAHGLLVVLAFVAELGLLQAQLQHVHDLEGALLGCLQRDAKAIEFKLLVARADAQVQPAVAQLVHHGHVGNQAGRGVQRRHHDAAAQADAPRDGGHVGDHGQR